MTCYLEASEASEDIITKSKSQALYVYHKNQILKSWWKWQPSFLHFCSLKHRRFTS